MESQFRRKRTDHLHSFLVEIAAGYNSPLDRLKGNEPLSEYVDWLDIVTFEG